MRKRVFIIMVLPFAIFLWVFGWTLFWAGSKGAPPKTKQAESVKFWIIEEA